MRIETKTEKKIYQFAHVVIEIIMPQGMPMPENLQKFECQTYRAGKSDAIQKTYLIEWTNALQEIEGDLRSQAPGAKEIQRENLKVRTEKGRECRVMNFPGAAEPYAISLEEDESTNKVWVDEKIAPMLTHDTIFASLLSLEKLMMKYESLILHSAYMLREGKAVLFSAPSETGKSTQADLWQKYRKTRTINGDRSLLVREADGWYAYGWPVCGSSEICHNEKHPIQTIVMLHQAEDNEVRKLVGFEAMQKLMAQITINMWNSEFQMKAMDKIEEIISEIPMYELGCNISEGAVECLERVL